MKRFLHRLAHRFGWNQCRHWEELVWSNLLQCNVTQRWGYQCIDCDQITVVRECDPVTQWPPFEGDPKECAQSDQSSDMMNRIRAIMREWDPIGVIEECNQDEYDVYAYAFYDLVAARDPVGSIVLLMEQIVTMQMDLKFDRLRAMPFAERIAALALPTGLTGEGGK